MAARTMPDPSQSTGYLKLTAFYIITLGALLVFVEGLASVALVLRDMVSVSAQSLAEPRHTKYDPDLGWVNEPSVDIPDMYGPGVYLRTNRQGFRSNHAVATAVPRGKHRIICSGDSFTLGYGVDNDHTWCQLLTSIDPRLETVNMGQGGYGIDQAYLWYKRDGARLEHQVHVLAFITHDFERMRFDRYLGYGKPMLDVEDGRLVVKNVPVPRRAYILPWLTSYAHSLRQLRTVEFLTRVVRKMGLLADHPGDVREGQTDEETRKVLALLLRDLQRINEEKSSLLALVYLPTLGELKGDEPREWIEFMERETAELKIPFISLFDAFRSLPAGEIENQYAGHFSVQGNELVARLIYDELLRDHPLVSKALLIEKNASVSRDGRPRGTAQTSR